MGGVILQEVHGACKWVGEVRVGELEGLCEIMEYRWWECVVVF